VYAWTCECDAPSFAILISLYATSNMHPTPRERSQVCGPADVRVHVGTTTLTRITAGPQIGGARIQLGAGYGLNGSLYRRNVHNIMLSPYIDYTVGSEQYTWLVNDLQGINRTTTPWVRRASPGHPSASGKPAMRPASARRALTQPMHAPACLHDGSSSPCRRAAGYPALPYPKTTVQLHHVSAPRARWWRACTTRG